MDDLIEALRIFKRYSDHDKFPTSCEHDRLYVTCVDPDKVPPDVTDRLLELGFEVEEDADYPGTFHFISYRFGSS